MSMVHERMPAAARARAPGVARLTGDAIDRLAPASASAATAFFDARWIRAWEHAFVPSSSWRGPVVAHALVADGGWLALARQRAFGLSVAALAGYYWPFRTAAIASDEAARRLARDLTDRRPSPVLRLGPVSTRDAGIGRLQDAMLRAGWRGFFRDTGQVFEIELPASAEGIHATMSASLLKNIRYSRRRLERERGPVETTRHVLRGDCDSVLAMLEAIEAESWLAHEGGETKFLGEANRRFWRVLASHDGAASEIVFWVLRCAGLPVAFSAHVETATTVYILANTYREDWKQSSPGSVLSLELLEDACARGRKRIDWGQGDSGYKSRFGATPQAKLRDVMLFAPGIAGTATRAAATPALREWKRLGHG